MNVASILWRRLDVPGHDACRLDRLESGWRVDGSAISVHENRPAHLAYRVTCDEQWLTTDGVVRGWIGGREVEIVVKRRKGGTWLLNDLPVSKLDDCVDLDLGFTPATNLLQLRRCALEIGDAADVPVAWLDVATSTLSRLDQRYERRSTTIYSYHAPRFGYRAELAMDDTGFVGSYPGLWKAECAGGSS